MSVRLMGQVWTLEIPHGIQTVLLALCDHADDDGNRVYPTARFIAWKTHYSIRQVQRIIHELRGRGVLVPVRAGGGRGRAVEYRIDLTPLPAKTPLPRTERNYDTTTQFPRKTTTSATETTTQLRRTEPSVEPPSSSPPTPPAGEELVIATAETVYEELRAYHGWPRTGTRTLAEVPVTCELLRAGFPPAVIIAEGKRFPTGELRSIKGLHYRLNERVLAEARAGEAIGDVVARVWEQRGQSTA